MKIRKLFLGAFAVGAVAITLTTTTYAWFRIGSSAYVNNLEFRVISGLGFKVAVDGTNSAFFTDTLSTSQMTSAILHKYNPDKYVIYKNRLFEKEELESGARKYTLLDSIYEDKINRTDSENADVTKCVNDKIKLVKDLIKLDEVTTMKVNNGTLNCDGFTLYNEYGELITDNSKYLEFDLYFKTDSDRSEDGQHFGIYLSDDTTYNPYGDSKKEADGQTNYSEEMNPTKIIGETQKVKLFNTLSYMNLDHEVVNLKSKDYINVNIANAIRFAKRDNGEITVTPKPTSEGSRDPKQLEYDLDDNKSFTITDSSVVLETADDKEIMASETDMTPKIYELADEGNLGSYATNYNEGDEELDRLYNSNYNAMWTYYDSTFLQSLKGTDSDIIEPLDYEQLKELYDNGMITNKLTDDHKVTKLDSGLKAHKVTFRFWLEGYDADYFAGVSGLDNLRCNLSFKVNSRLT